MTIQNYGKLVVAIVTTICLTVLLMTDSIDQAAGMGPITLIVGYIIGNGVAARTGKTVEPIVAPKDDPAVRPDNA